MPFLVSSGNLEPEEITSYELAYQAYRHNHRSTLNLKLFREDIKNLISQINLPNPNPLSPNLFDLINTDEAQIEGFEASFDHKFLNSIRLVSGYSYQTVESNNIADQYSMSVPENSLFLMFIYNMQYNFSISFNYYYYDEFRWLDSSDSLDISKLDTH